MRKKGRAQRASRIQYKTRKAILGLTAKNRGPLFPYIFSRIGTRANFEKSVGTPPLKLCLFCACDSLKHPTFTNNNQRLEKSHVSANEAFREFAGTRGYDSKSDALSN